MTQIIQTVQTFLTYIVPVVCIALVYFLGRIRPIGKFYATLLLLPGSLLLSLATFLSPFAVEQKSDARKHPGLRTIVLLVALLFALIAILADGYNALQALGALWDNTSLTLPPLPDVFTYSMGWLFLSLPALTGAIWLEKNVPLEAQIFNVPERHKPRFERFIFLTFLLSLVASVAFNALKPAYTADSTSPYTEVLRVCVFVLTGALLPLVMAITLYILSLGIHAAVSLLLTIAWFLSSSLATLLEMLITDFSLDEKSLKNKAIYLQDSEADHQETDKTPPPVEPFVLVETKPIHDADNEKPHQPKKDGVFREYELKFIKKVTPLYSEQEALAQVNGHRPNEQEERSVNKATTHTAEATLPPPAPTPEAIPAASSQSSLAAPASTGASNVPARKTNITVVNGKKPAKRGRPKKTTTK